MKFAVIGNPIDKSLSPQLHEILYKELNISNCSFEKIHIENDKLNDFFNNDFDLFNGINVTIPFKNRVVKFLDNIDDDAKILGNINCISKSNNMICGFNTDKHGFDMLLKKNEIIVDGTSCIILGAGSSAKTVVKCLIDQGVNKIIIKNRSINNAHNLSKFAQKLGFENIELFSSESESCDIAINTTPIGMYNDDLDNFFDIPVNEHTTLIDLIYTSRETLFLKKLYQCSQKINGLDMFIFQALKSIEIWRETNYNLDSQIESVRKQLENIKC
jgi:shikimate dehydrogenase